MEKYYSISVNAPEKDADKIRDVMGKAGAGRLGNYSHGSFSIKGIGRGMALKGADPAIGQIGKMEEIVEERIESFCTEDKLQNVIQAIKKAHPYEEPVITFYPIEIA